MFDTFDAAEYPANVYEATRISAYAAFKVLVDVYSVKKPTKDDMAIAINEAIGYLSEISAE